MKAFKILVTNQKGGVGKSTIAANLAAYLSIQHSLKVHLIDYDRQSSSSSWVKRAPDIGLIVFKCDLPTQNTGLLVLSEAKRGLEKFSANCDISISDLTWSYSMPPIFLLEYDLILVPSSTSKFEIASTEIFILEYIQKYLSQINHRKQKISVVPSRVDKLTLLDSIFLNLQKISPCSISPPVFFNSYIEKIAYQDFFCTANNTEASDSFLKFGEYIFNIIGPEDLEKGDVLKNSSILSNVPTAKFTQSRRKQLISKNIATASGWIPPFLLKK